MIKSLLLTSKLLGPLTSGLAVGVWVYIELMHNVSFHAMFAVGRGEKTEDGEQQLDKEKIKIKKCLNKVFQKSQTYLFNSQNGAPLAVKAVQANCTVYQQKKVRIF